MPYNKDSFLFLSFADPLAIESEKGTDTDDGESSLDYSGIAVSVIANEELNGIVKVIEVESETEPLGYKTIEVLIDGAAAEFRRNELALASAGET